MQSGATNKIAREAYFSNVKKATLKHKNPPRADTTLSNLLRNGTYFNVEESPIHFPSCSHAKSKSS